jgi:hypothetical protein
MHDRCQSEYPVSTFKIVPREERDPERDLHETSSIIAKERATGLARLREVEEERKQTEIVQKLVNLWPVMMGVSIGCFAPVLRDLISPLGPWGVRVVFPLAALAGYRGVQFGALMSHLLPQILLYAQFPLEGLLIKFVLRGRVTVAGAAVQVFIFHLLGAVGLWLISSGLAQSPMY